MRKTYMYIIPLLCLIAGVTAGVIQARGIGADRLNTIEAALKQGLGNTHEFSGTFMGNTLTNGGYIFIIWLTAFIPWGYAAAGFILFIRAMGYGYTLAALLLLFHRIGFTYIAGIGAQGVILLAAAYLLCVSGLWFRKRFKDKSVVVSKRGALAYFIVLLIAESGVVLASML